MRIILVDDHPLFRQALAMTITQIGLDVSVEQFDTLAAVRESLLQNPDTDLVLLDLKLPDSSGVSGLLALKAQFPRIPVAIVSANDDQDMVRTASACGAAGFISKAVGIQELTAAVEAMARGESWFQERSCDDDAIPLTNTQARILDGVHRGLMNKQIAGELGISEATVKYHLTGLFRRMGVFNRAQLLALGRSRDTSPAS